MQRSTTPTDFVIVKAETNSEYDSCDFALVRLTTNVRSCYHTRMTRATKYSDDATFFASMYEEKVEFFIDEHGGKTIKDDVNPILDMLGEDLWMFVEVTESEIEEWDSPAAELGTCHVYFSKEGAMFFVASNDQDEEFMTEGMKVEELIKL